MPAVSVIVPDWDPRATRDPRVEALLAQDEGDWEAILLPIAEPVGGAVARAGQTDPRVRSSDPARAGGDYVLVLGADDRLDPAALGRLLATARATGADLVLSDVEEQRADGSSLRARSRSGLIAAWTPGVILGPDDAAIYVEDGLRGTLIARALLASDDGLDVPQRVDDPAAWVEVARSAARIALAADARVLRSEAPTSLTSEWLDRADQADLRLAATLPADARRTQLADALAHQWWPRLRDVASGGAEAPGERITAVARRLADVVARGGLDVGWRMTGLLDGIGRRDWAERPLRAEDGADLNPLSSALAGRGLAERAGRLQALVALGRVDPAWARRYADEELIRGAAWLSDAERRALHPALLPVVELLYPGRRRWRLLPTSRMRLGARRRGVTTTGQLLDQAIALRTPTEGRTSGPGRGRPVAVFPDWSDANPLLGMLWSVPETEGRRLVRLRARNRSLAWLRASEEPAVIHLHWTDPILGGAEDETTARTLADEFLAALDERLRSGSRLLWTVHNVLPHDAAAPAATRRLHAALARRASAVHVMTRGTADAVGDDYPLPAERVRYIPHASYREAYGEALSPAAARDRLGVPREATTVLFFGRLRAYKGLDALVAAVAERREAGQQLHVLLAGQPGSEAEGEELAASFRAAGVELTSAIGFVDPELVPAWFSAADVIALPYTRVLNSGTILLAATFGLPVIATRSPGLAAEYGELPWVRLVDADAPVEGLSRELGDVAWYRDPAVRAAAQDFARDRTVVAMSTAYAGLLDELDPRA